MTKKHFIELAEMVRDAKPTNNPEDIKGVYYVAGDSFKGALMQWEKMRDNLADYCKSQNYNFNRERWMDYIDGLCGPCGGKVKQ